ncbi:MAG: hypothetical protein Ta2A_19010 [Treponemataceae bacterium]|nr:MAG: hypothetical protein Ta2A_19010 [Treponemataceae bacterium]
MGDENTLPLVTKLEEILQNVTTLDTYLENPNGVEYGYTQRLICRGHCFAVISSENGYVFYPSRFMGYIKNSREAHEKMGEMKRITGRPTRDGKQTNPAITEILGDFIAETDDRWGELESEYRAFCKKLKIFPSDIKRKYWQPISRQGVKS